MTGFTFGQKSKSTITQNWKILIDTNVVVHKFSYTKKYKFSFIQNKQQEVGTNLLTAFVLIHMSYLHINIAFAIYDKFHSIKKYGKTHSEKREYAFTIPLSKTCIQLQTV